MKILIKILTISILIFSCNQNETNRKPITTWDDTRKYIEQNFNEPIETLWIADTLNDQGGILMMALIDDGILEGKYIPDGFEQMNGYRIYKYKKAKLKLSLDNFNGTANDVDSCSCYFSKSDDDFKNNIYFFTAGFDSIGYVSINNKLTTIKLDSTDRKPDTCGDCGYTDYYSSGQYKVIVRILFRMEFGNGEEPAPYSGAITIVNTEGNKVTERLVGECGNPESFYQTNTYKMYTIIKQKISTDWIKVNDNNFEIYIGIDKIPQIHLTYYKDKYGFHSEGHQVTDVKNYKDSIVLITDNFHGDSIFNWTFKPIKKNKGYWSVYKTQTNKYEKLGLFKAKEEE